MHDDSIDSTGFDITWKVLMIVRQREMKEWF